MNNTAESHEMSLTSSKDVLSQMGPLDELLGSVSYNDIDGVEGKTHQLRTSARVFKKMKYDQTVNAAPPEKKEKKEEVKQEEVKQEKEKKLVNTFWSLEEKKLFFDALNEYGKDFESIHMYVSSRLKKKGVPDEQIKTKHQVRHFYYKTFHMLFSSLKFSDNIPKNVQELYTLINYGEMRRKMGSVSKKNWMKLNELMCNGSISMRIKGKMVKIKTPMCKALRRLNQLDEKYDDLKLPTRVLVEVRPKDMASFLKVQSMAQNPRIRIAVSLQKRLSTLITCISNRWKTSEAVTYDKALISTNVITKDCVPDQKVIDENSLLLTPFLRLSPSVETKIELPSLDISEYFTGQSICLTAFETRKGVKPKEEPKIEESTEPASKAEKSPTSVKEVVSEAVNTILSLQIQDSPNKCDSAYHTSTTVTTLATTIPPSTTTTTSTPSPTTTNKKSLSKEEETLRIQQIREGWTLENCCSLMIGELYLMFGSGSKLVLEYSWDPIQVKPKDVVAQQEQENVEEEEINKIQEEKENNLTHSLKKLLSIAKLQLKKSEPKCTCGHVCGARPAPQFKKPTTNKIIKKAQISHEHHPENEVIGNEVTQEKAQELSDDTSNQSSNSSMVHLFNQLDTMQRLNPRCRSRGRPRCRQFVVERKLVPNKSESKHQIVSMNIVSQENDPTIERPIKDSTASKKPSTSTGGNGSKMIVDEDFSILSDNPSNLSATGISKILKENENQWMESDVADYSLSSLLGHLDGSSKTSASLSNEDSQLCQNVDAQLHTLLMEASVDYTAKFADLAAQVTDNSKK